MKTLSLKEQRGLQDRIKTLSRREEDLKGAVTELNDLMEKGWDKVKEAQQQYNDAVSEAWEFADCLYTDLVDWYDEQPDEWKETSEGGEYEEWMKQFSNIDEAEVDLDEPEKYDMNDLEDDLRTRAQLEDLTTEP